MTKYHKKEERVRTQAIQRVSKTEKDLYLVLFCKKHCGHSENTNYYNNKIQLHSQGLLDIQHTISKSSWIIKTQDVFTDTNS